MARKPAHLCFCGILSVAACDGRCIFFVKPFISCAPSQADLGNAAAQETAKKILTAVISKYLYLQFVSASVNRNRGSLISMS